MSATIYQIINKLNSKSYIGFDSHFPNRINDHKNIDGTSPALDNAVRKYGWENFSFKILYEGKDPQYTLNIKEPFFIRKHKTKKPNGYNLTNGGEGQPGKIPWNKGKKTGPLSDTTKNKMSLSHQGKPHPHKSHKLSKETKRKISILKSGKNHHMYGKHHTEKSKKKTSKSMIKYHSLRQHNSSGQ